MAKKSNPNNANQYQLDPRQKLCWDFYVDPKSETFGNITHSALKAGYEESYSDTISQSEWFCAKVWRLNATNKAEKVFQDVINADHINQQGGIDSSVLRIKADVAKFLASTQGKNEGYSTRVENTGSNGEPIVIQIAKEISDKNGL